MPPESFSNKPASIAGDIWATGCILYEAMKGDILFESKNAGENTRDKVA